MKNALYPFIEECIREFHSRPVQVIGFIMFVLGAILLVTIGGYLVFSNLPFLIAMGITSVVMVFFGGIMLCD